MRAGCAWPRAYWAARRAEKQAAGRKRAGRKAGRKKSPEPPRRRAGYRMRGTGQVLNTAWRQPAVRTAATVRPRQTANWSGRSIALLAGPRAQLRETVARRPSRRIDPLPGSPKSASRTACVENRGSPNRECPPTTLRRPARDKKSSLRLRPSVAGYHRWWRPAPRPPSETKRHHRRTSDDADTPTASQSNATRDGIRISEHPSTF